jgi:hypothetical protein
MRRTAIFSLLAFLALPAIPFADLAPLTDETVVGRLPDADYYFSDPAVAPRGDGFMVAWTAFFSRYSGSNLTDWGGGINARTIGADGQPVGTSRALVPEMHHVDFSSPAFATDGAGRYAVVWGTAPEHHPYFDYKLRQFSAAGAVTSNLGLDRFATPDSFTFPPPGALALGTTGHAFAVWPRPLASAPAKLGLFGQLFGDSGRPLGPRSQLINRAGFQSRPSVGTDRRGNSVLVYENRAANGAPAVFLRLFDAAGRPKGADIRVSPDAAQAGASALDVSPGGRFAVVWQEAAQIWARVFEASALPVGAAFQVNIPTVAVREPDVAIGSDGTLLFVWREADAPDHTQIVARAFDMLGNPLGEAFRLDRERPVPEGGTPSSGRAVVAASENDTFLVAWEIFNSTTGNHLIVARLLGAAGDGPAVTRP